MQNQNNTKNAIKQTEKPYATEITQKPQTNNKHKTNKPTD